MGLPERPADPLRLIAAFTILFGVFGLKFAATPEAAKAMFCRCRKEKEQNISTEEDSQNKSFSDKGPVKSDSDGRTIEDGDELDLVSAEE